VVVDLVLREVFSLLLEVGAKEGGWAGFGKYDGGADLADLFFQN